MSKLHNLLIYRVLMTNVLLVCGVVFAFTQGWLHLVYETDISRISLGIVAALLVTLAAQYYRAYRVSRDINRLRTEPSEHVRAYEEDKSKALTKIEWMSDVSDWLMRLGLIGTVVGWFIALHGLDTAQLSPTGAQQMMAQVLQGMSVALLTTLTGAVSSLWVDFNYRNIKTATNNYWCDRI